jgi:hypothetical protein
LSGGERIELLETGQMRIAGEFVVAQAIWERAPLDDPDGPVGLRAQIGVGEGPAVDVAEGDEVAIGDERWQVEKIVEDPVNRRGHVVLVRAG